MNKENARQDFELPAWIKRLKDKSSEKYEDEDREEE